MEPVSKKRRGEVGQTTEQPVAQRTRGRDKNKENS